MQGRVGWRTSRRCPATAARSDCGGPPARPSATQGCSERGKTSGLDGLSERAAELAGQGRTTVEVRARRQGRPGGHRPSPTPHATPPRRRFAALRALGVDAVNAHRRQQGNRGAGSPPRSESKRSSPKCCRRTRRPELKGGTRPGSHGGDGRAIGVNDGAGPGFRPDVGIAIRCRHRCRDSRPPTVVLIALGPARCRHRHPDSAAAPFRKMHQNLGWAVGYNTAAIPIAAGVLEPQGFTLSPAVARPEGMSGLQHHRWRSNAIRRFEICENGFCALPNRLQGSPEARHASGAATAGLRVNPLRLEGRPAAMGDRRSVCRPTAHPRFLMHLANGAAADLDWRCGDHRAGSERMSTNVGGFSIATFRCRHRLAIADVGLSQGPARRLTPSPTIATVATLVFVPLSLWPALSLRRSTSAMTSSISDSSAATPLRGLPCCRR